MRLLLDTHAFLWWVTASPEFSRRARDLVADSTNEIFFSAASGWELAIKAGLGRVRLPEDPERFIPTQVAANAFEVLPVHLRHALQVFALPALHRDPFDRMLVAQAIVEGMAILSSDPLIARYPVEVVW